MRLLKMETNALPTIQGYQFFSLQCPRCPVCAGFAGVADFNFWQSGALLALNTFGAFVAMALTLPLTCAAPQLPATQSQYDSLSADADAPADYTGSIQPPVSSKHEPSTDMAAGSTASAWIPNTRLPFSGDRSRPWESRAGSGSSQALPSERIALDSSICNDATTADARTWEQGNEQLNSGETLASNQGNRQSTGVTVHNGDREALDELSSSSNRSGRSSGKGIAEHPPSVCVERQVLSTAVTPNGVEHNKSASTEVVGLHTKSGIDHHLRSAALVFLTVRTLNATVSTISAAVQRRHLMVWALFAPKFLFDACILIVCDVSAIIACTLALAVVRRS